MRTKMDVVPEVGWYHTIKSQNKPRAEDFWRWTMGMDWQNDGQFAKQFSRNSQTDPMGFELKSA